jgi:SAM-dependent methyltransferase
MRQDRSGVSQTPPYTLLARFYDPLTPGAPAMNRWARRRILGRLLPRVRSACDLGCGSGTTAIDLARRGIAVSAVDASPGQCRAARAKARRAGVPLRVLNADMRRFTLPRPVDLVLSEFNALNHLPRKADLAPTFRRIARALRPGGWLYFDVNMWPTYRQHYPVARWVEGPGFCLTTHGGFDRRRGRAWLICEWFVRERRTWRRYRERIDDVFWTHAEIRSALRRAGFTRIRSWDGARISHSGHAAPPGVRPVRPRGESVAASTCRVDHPGAGGPGSDPGAGHRAARVGGAQVNQGVAELVLAVAGRGV